MSKTEPTAERKPKNVSGDSAPRRMRRPSGIAEDGSRWLWPFQLTEQIGEGGMGVVFRARYVVNGREVAVKMLPTDVQDSVILARFEQEMAILKDLKHPNIVRSFGGVCENENRFYAMELVEGGSLEDDIQARGKLPWEQVVEYAEQMVSALQASHEKGIVHRDVKPGNFLKTKSGKLKLADFGLARIDAGRKITRAGKTAGTVLYMAPEQIRGLDITPSADLYALGCVLYELLTGRTPFEGDSAAAVLHAHVSQEPARLGQFATDCPPVLEELVHQLLAKAPEDRPESAAEVGSRLGSLADTINVTRGSSGLASGLSSRPTTLPDSRTRPLDTRTVLAREILDTRRVPGWAIGLGVAIALFLLSSVVWQASEIAALRPWKQQWMEAARSPGPTQAFALRTLAQTAPDDPDVVAVIIAQLESSEAASRTEAAEAAAFLKSGEIRLIGLLNRLAKSDESDAVRYAAKRASTNLQRVR